MILDMPTLMVAVAVATTCCAVARILLYRLHPGMGGLGHWALASIAGALSFAVFGLGGGASTPDLALSVAHGLIVFGFCLVWDGFRRFQGRRGLSLGAYVAWGAVTLSLVMIANQAGSLALRATFNSSLIFVISACVAWELLARCPPHRLSMRLCGWIYGVNALFFAARAGSIVYDHAFLAGSVSYGVTAIASLWWLCVTVSVTLCMILMAGERLQEELNEQASRDPLTGALNRRAFTAMAEREVALARRAVRPLSVVMIDMDHFKLINDNLGHGGGDEALMLFVGLAGRILRTEDLLCRFGGEEFLALLPGSSTQEALGVTERLRTAFTMEAKALDPEGRLSFPMTLSAGITALEPGDGIEEAIRRADAALYRAKEAGRDRCELAGR